MLTARLLCNNDNTILLLLLLLIIIIIILKHYFSLRVFVVNKILHNFRRPASSLFSLHLNPLQPRASILYMFFFSLFFFVAVAILLELFCFAFLQFGHVVSVGGVWEILQLYVYMNTGGRCGVHVRWLPEQSARRSHVKHRNIASAVALCPSLRWLYILLLLTKNVFENISHLHIYFC